MPLTLSARFEVFKRDGFTCQYCGRKTPDVVLEVDHVIPRAADGGDEPENLVTACFDCNHGKAARLLDDRAPTPSVAAQADMLCEREEQLRAYHELRDEITERRNQTYDTVRNHWFDVWGATSLNRWHMPWDNTLRAAVDKLGPTEVMDAMDITATRFGYVTSNAVRYFGGILKRKVAAYDGRIVQCIYCREDMVLTAQEAAKEGLEGWYHIACKPDDAGD
jgi:HNH endonuclease